MPRRCCVPGCRSNYKGESYTNIFSFPKNSDMKLKWESQIHRKDFISTSSSVVCVKHFDEKFIERDHHATRPDGTLMIVPRKSPILKPGAYPTVFAKQPSYLSSKLPTKRKSPEERNKEIDDRQEKQFQQFLESDKIEDFKEFKTNFRSRLMNSWLVISDENSVYLGKPDLSDMPTFLISVKISQDLIISVWHNNLLVPKSDLEWLLGKDLKCTMWSAFDCLISHLNAYHKEMSYDAKLRGIARDLNSIIEECDNAALNETLVFLHEQLEICLMKLPRYSPQMLLWASKFYFSNPAAYRLVRESNKLILPHPYYLKTLLQNLGSLQSSQIRYLTKKCGELLEVEKIVGLMMDEIYVKPGICYKGGRIEGLAVNSDNTEASTIQAFMITSLFSKNKDVVGLFPVKNQTAEDLQLLLRQVLKILNNAGYRVLYVTADNNRVNRKAYEKLCGGQLTSSTENPEVPGDVLFLIFDTVHCMKSVRNNWLNQQQTNQTFFIPRMKSVLSDNTDTSSNKDIVMYASITHLKTLYREEYDNNLKLAPSLSRKSLYPNHLERQDVGQALKLFDEKLIPALKEFENKIGKDGSGTMHFIDIFSKFWKIVNVKTPHKGNHKRDEYSDPIYSPNCHNIQFLENFCSWLQEWESVPPPPFSKSGSRCGKLSRETSFALIHTTKTLILICKHLFQNVTPPPRYILLGKFQTDCLEARFGQYRYMSGGNYHVSVAQVLESERKLKVLSLLTLKSSKMGSFNIKNFMESCKESEDDVPEMLEFFLDVILLSEIVEISTLNLKVLVFIAGYVARKASEPCINCKLKLAIDKELDYDVNDDTKHYLKELDHGGMLWPNDFTMTICVAVFKIFQTCITVKYEEQFLNAKNQRYLLCELSKEKLQDDGVIFKGICDCGKTVSRLINDCVKIMSNILLNNYTKTRNDKLPAKTSIKRKIATVNSS